MRMRKIIVSILLMVLIVVAFVPHNVYADDLLGEMKKQATGWLAKGEETGKGIFVDKERKRYITKEICANRSGIGYNSHNCSSSCYSCYGN